MKTQQQQTSLATSQAGSSWKQNTVCPLMSATLLSQTTLYTAGARTRLSRPSTHQPLPKAPNYCFVRSSGCYREPRLSLDETAMAVGTATLRRTHCQWAHHNGPSVMKLKGVQVTWTGSSPHSHPEANLEVKKSRCRKATMHLYLRQLHT